MKNIAVIGGGAAGFFAALSAAQHHPHAGVTLFEKSSKLLAKVKVSGGGRCNVTHACWNPKALSEHYPRGGKFLRRAFERFQVTDTVQWFSQRGVQLKTEQDGRMFPVTDASQTIIDCLLNEAERSGIRIVLGAPVRRIYPKPGGGFEVNERGFDCVIVATGGSPKLEGLDWLASLGHSIVPPVPSLFRFNMPGNGIKTLMGVVVKDAAVRIQGMKRVSRGPVLMTHWGMSGPAILKLSSWHARELAEVNYQFPIQINWLGDLAFDQAEAKLQEEVRTNPKRQVGSSSPFGLPKKFWQFLLHRLEVPPNGIWSELSKKNKHRILDALLNDVHQVNGKTTFKEEFVTCGGVSLTEVDVDAMSSRVLPGLYFAGEVLDVDGVTGGFNFQAAWTTGFLAGQLK